MCIYLVIFCLFLWRKQDWWTVAVSIYIKLKRVIYVTLKCVHVIDSILNILHNFSKGIWQSVRHKLIGALTLDMCQTSEILYDYNLYLTTYYIHVDLSQLCSVLQCSMTSYNVHSIITSHNVLRSVIVLQRSTVSCNIL